MHIPVLAKEVCELLSDQENPKLDIVDETFGYGGHYKAISKYLGDRLGTYTAIDQDPTGFEAFVKAHEKPNHLKFLLGNFRKLDLLLPPETKVDAVLFDLGVSTPQIKEGGKGLSVHEDEPLDMRLSPLFHKKTALDVIQELSLKELKEALSILTPLRSIHKIALNMKDFAENKSEPQTTQRLIQKLRPYLPPKSKTKTHPATTLFMMLRILVNDEVGVVEEGVARAVSLLKPGGRLMVISFHGFEHRLVKSCFLELKNRGKIQSVISPSADEIQKNISAKSSRLQVFELTNGDGEFSPSS